MEFGPILRSMRRNKVRYGLIVAEVALTLAVVANCVNMIRDARRQMAIVSGFDDDNLIRVNSRPFAPAFKEDGYLDNSVRQDLAALRALPGVKAASNTRFLPWQGGGSSMETRVLGSKGPMQRNQVYNADEGTLETILRDYGDERRARRLAAEIVRRRARHAFATSDDLVNANRATLGAKAGPPDFARLVQAVRIAVNDELGGLERALPAFRDALTPGGRIKTLVGNASTARYLPGGYLLFDRDGTIFAAPFDLGRLELTGPEMPLLEGLAQDFSAEPISTSLAAVRRLTT